MNPIKAVIVDDEKTAREGLKSLLTEVVEVELVKSCKDGMEAIEYLQQGPCDLLFLDIQMPAISGFEVLKSIKSPPATIFITAFDEFAVQAFEHHALDYLLKPFTNTRFFESVDRAKSMIRSQKIQNATLHQLLEYLQQHDQPTELVSTNTTDKSRLVIRSSGKIILLNTADIRWIEAYDYYIRIHCHDKTYVIRESLKGIQEKLPIEIFIRVHKSAIVNTSNIKSLEHLQNSEYMINLNDGTQVKVSRSYKADVDRFLGII
ncbi:MAG: response regulator transcription factor [Roseivirga sp.]|nr:response regulator transcription factor [Roseivirga sp.]